MRITILAAALAATAALAGCASLPGLEGYGYGDSYSRPYPNSAGVYTPGESQQIQRVETGTVIAIQPVAINASGGHKMLGEAAGAGVGGLLGNQIGSGRGKTLATIAGAIGGAVAGNAIAGRGYKQQGLQITIRLDKTGYGSGRTIAVTQQTGPTFTIGERVEVIGSGYGSSPARVEPIGQ